jgi:hypothetical protein
LEFNLSVRQTLILFYRRPLRLLLLELRLLELDDLELLAPLLLLELLEGE